MAVHPSDEPEEVPERQAVDSSGWDVEEVGEEAEPVGSDDVDVGTVLEIHDEVRVVDVFDPDGNRLQLVEQLRL